MKTEMGIYPIGSLHNVCDKPGKSMKTNICMEDVKSNYSSGSLQVDCANPGYTVKMKDDMKVGTRIRTAIPSISQQSA